MFAASQLWGKVGRAFLGPLSERQYTRTYRENLDKAIQLALEEWLKPLDNAPRRKLKLNPEADTCADCVIFTDGFYPDTRRGESGQAQVGGVALVKGGTRPQST